MMPFFCIHISQGSVATCVKRGGIFKHQFVANLLPSQLVKKIENRIIVGEVMATSLVSCFLTHGVYSFTYSYSFINITVDKMQLYNTATIKWNDAGLTES